MSLIAPLDVELDESDRTSHRELDRRSLLVRRLSPLGPLVPRDGCDVRILCARGCWWRRDGGRRLLWCGTQWRETPLLFCSLLQVVAPIPSIGSTIAGFSLARTF